MSSGEAKLENPSIGTCGRARGETRMSSGEARISSRETSGGPSRRNFDGFGSRLGRLTSGAGFERNPGGFCRSGCGAGGETRMSSREARISTLESWFVLCSKQDEIDLCGSFGRSLGVFCRGSGAEASDSFGGGKLLKYWRSSGVFCSCELTLSFIF